LRTLNSFDGQAQNPGLPSLCEYISHSYGQARWPGMAADPETDKWADEVGTIRISGTAVGNSRHGAPHCITSNQAGSMIDRNGNALADELITHVDSISIITMSLHRALQGPEYTSVSLASRTHLGTPKQSLSSEAPQRHLKSARLEQLSR